MNEVVIAIVRSFIAFCTLFIVTRILGKQQISQLTFFEYVTGITIGSIAAELSVTLSSKALVPWSGLMVWSLLTLGFQWMMLKNRKIAKVIEGEPVVIIQNGKIFEHNMRLVRLRVDDLMVMLRQKDVFDLNEVEFAVMEPNGRLSVLKKSQDQPVTPRDLKIPTAYKGLPTELIVDGTVIEQNLKQVNLTMEWLEDQLRRKGLRSVKDVFYAELNTQGELYVSPYSNRPQGMVADASDSPGAQ